MKKDNWFKNYHEIPELGIKGLRTIKNRIQYYDVNDFKDASVLDIGCNVGQMSFQAEKWGASHVIGVEYDRAALENARNNKKLLKSSVIFTLEDIDNPLFWRSFNSVDIVLFLAVFGTKELKDKFAILSRACAKTKKVMYFEGHRKAKLEEYIKNILEYTDFNKIEFLGHVGQRRVFIRCSREFLTYKECVKKILELKDRYNKIAVIGKGEAGKTYTRKLLGDCDTHLVVDDRKTSSGDKLSIDQLNSIDKIILFDYRALLYIKDFEVVFFLTPVEKLLQTAQRMAPRARTNELCFNYSKIERFYTVITRDK